MNLDDLFVFVTGLGISPSEFWDMTLSEVRTIIAAQPEVPVHGNLTPRQCDELLEFMRE